MSQQTMRGMRLGTQSLESERGVSYEPRGRFTYQCSGGHQTEMVFASGAELPQTWECKVCSKTAVLLENGEQVALDLVEEKIPRSHWQMLLERRSIEELEEILEERLQDLRARREAAAAKK